MAADALLAVAWSSEAWLPGSCGRGRKGGARPVLTGKIVPGWVMTTHLTHGEGTQRANGKSQHPSLLHSLFRTSHSLVPATGVWEKHQPRPGAPPLPEVWAANLVQRPQVGRSHLREPWLSKGPGDGVSQGWALDECFSDSLCLKPPGGLGPTPEMLTQEVWGEAREAAFLTSSQVLQQLLLLSLR